MSALILNSTWTISAVRNVDEWVLSTSGDRAIRVDLKITEFVDSWCNSLLHPNTTPAWKCVENAAPPRTHIPKMACIWVALLPSLVHRPRTVADCIGHLDVSQLGHSDGWLWLDHLDIWMKHLWLCTYRIYCMRICQNQLFAKRRYVTWIAWISTDRSASTRFAKVREHPCVGLGEKDSRHTS